MLTTLNTCTCTLYAVGLFAVELLDESILCCSAKFVVSWGWIWDSEGLQLVREEIAAEHSMGSGGLAS